MTGVRLRVDRDRDREDVADVDLDEGLPVVVEFVAAGVVEVESAATVVAPDSMGSDGSGTGAGTGARRE
jgi:hypothetical protein